jgi:hypothetical protein
MKKDEETMDLAIPGGTDITPSEMADWLGPQDTDMGIEYVPDVITIAHQNQAFQMPNGEMVKSFKGQIIDIVNVNAWWAETFDDSGGGTPPQCFSPDGIQPSPSSEDRQSQFCRNCPQNQFGSDGGRGKACKNMKRVHVFLEGEALPSRLVVPPTSMQAINQYASRLAKKVLAPYFVITKFGLKASQNKSGIKYSALELEIDSVLLDFSKGKESVQAQAKAIRDKRDELLPIMRDAVPTDFQAGADQPEGSEAPF